MLLQQTNAPVFLVDDEQEILYSASILLESAGIGPVIAVQDGRNLGSLLSEKGGASAIILDLIMPNVHGLDLLKMIMNDFPGTPVIVMTAVQDVASAVGCMKNGAFDYLVKPVEDNRFVSAIKRALEVQSLKWQVSRLRETLTSARLGNPEVFSGIITRSTRMYGLFQYLEAIATSPEPVLVIGETGVGKEMIVNAIHLLSNRKGKMIAFNAGGLDETTFSDTLFGHSKGAFTGAQENRKGLIVEAQGGTLFLDEIGEMSPVLQVKLLRMIQEKQFYPLGSDLPRFTDARIVCATNRDLLERCEGGMFRKDFYYRLSAHQLRIPPLRERMEDLPLLINHFLSEAAQSMGKKIPTPPAELFQLLSVYAFPGNVRELRSMIYDAVARHTSHILSLDSFRQATRQGRQSVIASTPSPINSDVGGLLRIFPDPLPTYEEVENGLTLEALRRCRGNQSLAANLLGVARQTFIRRLHRAQGHS